MSKTYPYVDELITNSEGQVVKVVLPIEEYQRLIDALEDEGLLRAMRDVQEEPGLSIEEALSELEKDENAL